MLVNALLAALVVASGALVGCASQEENGTGEQQVQRAAPRDDDAPVEFQEGSDGLDDFSAAGLDMGSPASFATGLTPTGVLVEALSETGQGGYVVLSPCGTETEVSSLEPLGDIQVVLDPGHGGDEPGAQDIPDLSEAELNLRLVEALLPELEQRQISAVSTRNGDYRIPVIRRAELADAVGPEIFVSIHHNNGASAPSAEPGLEIYIQNRSEESRRLGALLYQEVFGSLSDLDVGWSARSDAGVLVVLNDDGDNAYGINRHPQTTSVLVEMAYMGNPDEAALLQSSEYVALAVDALAEGIERYLTTSDAGTTEVQRPRLFNPSPGSGGTDGCVDPELE